MDLADFSSPLLARATMAVSVVAFVYGLIAWSLNARRLSRWIDTWQDYPVLLRSLTFFGSLLAGIGVAFLLQPPTGTRPRFWLAIATVGMAIALGRELVGHRSTRLLSGRDREAVVRRLLHSMSQVLVWRLEIPLPQTDGFKAVRSCVVIPTADGEKLRVWAQHGMDGDADRDLEFFHRSGLAGWLFSNEHARDEQMAAFDRITTQNDPRGHIEPADADRRVRPQMRSMLCAKIYDPRQPPGARVRPVLGILCIDSDMAANEIGFGDPDTVNIAHRTREMLAFLTPRR